MVVIVQSMLFVAVRNRQFLLEDLYGKENRYFSQYATFSNTNNFSILRSGFLIEKRDLSGYSIR